MTYDNITSREKRMPSISEKGRETEHMVLPDDAKYVGLDEAHEHGYWGVTPDTTDRNEYTFAGAAKRMQQNQQSSSSSGSSSSGSGPSGSGDSGSGTSSSSTTSKTSKTSSR